LEDGVEEEGARWSNLEWKNYEWPAAGRQNENEQSRPTDH